MRADSLSLVAAVIRGLPDGEQGEHRDAGAETGQNPGRPAVFLAFDQRDEQQHEGPGQQGETGQIEAAADAGAGAGQLPGRERHGDRADDQVDEEDPAPAVRRARGRDDQPA